MEQSTQAQIHRPSWLASLDIEEYTRLTGMTIDLILQGTHVAYVSPPAVSGAAVVATFELTTRHNPVRFVVRIEGISPQLRGTCNGSDSAQSSFIPVLTLLADLTVSKELREALLAGAPTGHIVDELPAARARALELARLGDAIDRWTGQTQSTGVLSIEAQIDPKPHEYAGLEEARLVLRMRRAGSRRVLPLRELAALPLSRDMRRLVGFCMDNARAGIVAMNGLGAYVLEILRDHPEWQARGIEFATATASVSIVRAIATLEHRFAAYLDPLSGRTRHHSPRPEPRRVDAALVFWRTADGALSAGAEEVQAFFGPTSFVKRYGEKRVFVVDPSVDISIVRKLQREPIFEVPPDGWEILHRRLTARLAGTGVSVPTRASLGLGAAPEPVLALRIDGTPLEVVARLEATYDDATFPVTTPHEPSASSLSGPPRNIEIERAAAQRVLSLGLSPHPEKGCFTAEGDAAVKLWTEGLSLLRGGGSPTIAVYLAEQLARVRVRRAIRGRVRAALVSGWMDTSVSFEADDMTAEMSAMRDALYRKRKWVLLRDGTIAEMTPEAEALVTATEGLLDSTGRARLGVPQIGLLEHWASSADSVEVDPAIDEARAKLRSLDVRAPELPEGLTATLRPYQKAGLAWLQFLDELNTGGILADDMGLGKTLMTLAFLAWKKEKRRMGPALVVCPTSVVGNWMREAARFTPGLTVLELTGANRAPRFARAGEVDLLITTYALLRLDIDELSRIEFHTVILDEAQNVKSAAAATTHAARRLRADQKLALTGTPVENRLGELWSILDFANPGMLGSERQFEERFERPISLGLAGPAAAELRARVRPFVLRRAKSQVLADLPPKQEIDITCLPGPGQRQVYDALAAVLRREVEASLDSQGLARSGLIVLTALLRLRQMCCDPRLVDPARPASLGAKRDVFLSLVRELRDEGRRALVFSQFVELLRLWRHDLDREGITYEYLDGSTTRRDDVVSRFQQGNATLFLLSLKAGGSGLNLTAADTVIHLDPWWNPAVEAQATDRSHRMGQARPVTVYRLILRGTIEEKIAELKEKKRAIADAVIRDDAGALRGLREDDVRLLLSSVDDSAFTGAEPSADVIDVSGVEVEDRREPAPAAIVRAAPQVPVTPRPTGPHARETEHVHGEALDALVKEVRDHLRKHGLMQKDLAARAEMSQPDMSLLVNGRLQRLGRAVAERLSRAMSETERR